MTIAAFVADQLDKFLQPIDSLIEDAVWDGSGELKNHSAAEETDLQHYQWARQHLAKAHSHLLEVTGALEASEGTVTGLRPVGPVPSED